MLASNTMFSSTRPEELQTLAFWLWPWSRLAKDRETAGQPSSVRWKSRRVWKGWI